MWGGRACALHACRAGACVVAGRARPPSGPAAAPCLRVPRPPLPTPPVASSPPAWAAPPHTPRIGAPRNLNRMGQAGTAATALPAGQRPMGGGGPALPHWPSRTTCHTPARPATPQHNPSLLTPSLVTARPNTRAGLALEQDRCGGSGRGMWLGCSTGTADVCTSGIDCSVAF